MSPESAAARLPANTPVIVGAGQYTERLDSPGFRGLSAVDLAAEAARCALREVGEAFLPGIDLVMTTRTFEDSVPVFAFEFGRSNNFPRSICRRLGCAPAQAVWADAGGNTPQELVAEACERIAAGEVTQVLVAVPRTYPRRAISRSRASKWTGPKRSTGRSTTASTRTSCSRKRRFTTA
jgi:acetyl-CoA C-acetyltransferase